MAANPPSPASTTPPNGLAPARAESEVAKIIPFDERLLRFKKVMKELSPALQQALPSYAKVERFIRIATSTVQNRPELLECTPKSLLASLYQCAQLGLETDGVLGQAYLVPFRNKGTLECQLIPGYRGLQKLAYQSGEVSSIKARVVREGDRFHYEYGLNERLEHIPDRGDNPGELVAVYATARIRGVDDTLFLVLERWQIDEIRKRSRASNDGPWVTDYEEMAKKSAIRRICKMLPASVEKDNLGRAVALDERAEAGISQEIDIGDDNVAPSLPAAEEALSGIRAQTAEPSKLAKLAAENRAKREGKSASKSVTVPPAMPKKNTILGPDNKPMQVEANQDGGAVGTRGTAPSESGDPGDDLPDMSVGEPGTDG